MRLYIHILTRNSRRFLPDLLKSLHKQTYQDFTVRILDNGSADGTVEFLQEKFPGTLVARNLRNIGFAEGHNQLIRYTLDHLPATEKDNAAIVWMNDDMILHPNALAELASAWRKNKGIGAIQPKIYRAFGQHASDEEIVEVIKSDILDSTGMSLTKSWRMVERGAGEMDKGQYDKQTDVFAPSGAMALMPINVIEDLMIGTELFDKDFFAYREDCDLGLRLRKRGWRVVFVPKAIVYHYRGMYGAAKMSFKERILNRRRHKSDYLKALATRNQWFVLLKNLTLADFILFFPYISAAELSRLLYIMFFEPKTVKVAVSSLSLLPKMWKKRKIILTSAKVKESELRKYARN